MANLAGDNGYVETGFDKSPIGQRVVVNNLRAQLGETIPDSPALRRMATHLNQLDAKMASRFGLPLREDVMNMRRIIGRKGPEGGLRGLFAAADRGEYLPVIATTAGLTGAARAVVYSKRRNDEA